MPTSSQNSAALKSRPPMPMPNEPVACGVACRRELGLLGRDVGFAHVPLGIDRAHEQVGDEADDQQPGEDVEDRPVDLVGRDAVGLARVVQVVDDHRADDAGRRPRREQASVDGADELRAEHVGEIGRNGREAAAVHRRDDAEAGDEQREDLPVRGERGEHVERGAEREEDEVGRACARGGRTTTPRRCGRRC